MCVTSMLVNYNKILCIKLYIQEEFNIALWSSHICYQLGTRESGEGLDLGEQSIHVEYIMEPSAVQIQVVDTVPAVQRMYRMSDATLRCRL